MLLRFFLLGPAHERLQRLGHLGRSHFLRFVIRAHHEARMDCRVHGDGRIEVPVELKLRVHWYCRAVVIAIRPGHVVILGCRPDCRHMLAARRRRRERVAATEFKAKVAPYLVEAPEL